jgi:hypothetical protein
VRATDTAGNTDASPATQSWTISSQVRTVFADGFETGDLSRWTTVSTATGGTARVQTDNVAAGTYAVRLAETAQAGSRAYLRKTLATAETELRVSGRFNIEAEGAKQGNVPIFRLFDPAGVRILSLYRANQAQRRIWISHSGETYSTTGKVVLGTWATFEVRATAAGASSAVTVLLNGAEIYRASAADLGMAGIASIQIGNETTGQAFQLAADEISATAP